MLPMRIEQDFVKRRRLPLASVAMLLAGFVAVAWTIKDFRGASIELEILEIGLARLVPDAANRAAETGPAINVDAVTAPLKTPWSNMLDDLEQASKEHESDVALLEIAPDRKKHSVRIAAEARTLAAALRYVETLQAAKSLRYPTLESHEVRTAQRERPVHFEIVADWNMAL